MEKYFKKLYPCIILRKLKIENDPMALFSTPYNGEVFEDFEYEYDGDADPVDGYEINLFDEESLVSFCYKNLEVITKKFLPNSFIGDRNEGDIGFIIEEQLANGASFKCFFSKEIHNEYFPLFERWYGHSSTESNKRMTSLLIENNRDKKIETICKV